jgi:hypothetical protein
MAKGVADLDRRVPRASWRGRRRDPLPRAVRVYFATQPTNLRQSFEGTHQPDPHALARGARPRRDRAADHELLLLGQGCVSDVDREGRTGRSSWAGNRTPRSSAGAPRGRLAGRSDRTASRTKQRGSQRNVSSPRGSVPGEQLI